MTGIRNFFAILACRVLIIAGRLAGKKGSSAPGKIALKISPSILKVLGGQIKKEIIAVCGTNGKTTTNNMICDLLEGRGYKVVCNRVGANMLPGVACAFAQMANPFKGLDADYAVLECDEASLRHIVKHITPDKVIITNMFRDQLDRYGAIEQTIGYLKEAIDKLPNVTLILNGDDPLCTGVGKDKNAIYFGIDQSTNKDLDELKEGRNCPLCQSELKYNYYHYSQLGDYFCSECSFKRPCLDYKATDIDLSKGMRFSVCYENDKCEEINLDWKGFYNIYNILGAFSVFHLLGEDTTYINEKLRGYKPQIGRMEQFTIHSKPVVFNLAKNPAGFNQAISTVAEDSREKDIMLVLNDKPSDGIDIGWIWDVDFEKLADGKTKTVYVSGIRRHDLALRLKYSGLENIEITDTDPSILDRLIKKDGEVCYVLVNYTALFSTHSYLKQLEEKEGK